MGLPAGLWKRRRFWRAAFEISATMAEKNPLGLRMTKEAINQNLGVGSLEQALHLENRNQAFLIAAMKLNA